MNNVLAPRDSYQNGAPPNVVNSNTVVVQSRQYQARSDDTVESDVCYSVSSVTQQHQQHVRRSSQGSNSTGSSSGSQISAQSKLKNAGVHKLFG